MEPVEILLARHDERISDLEKWRDKQYKILEKIQEELKEMRQDYERRPTWGVALLLSILSTLTGTMAVYIITNL